MLPEFQCAVRVRAFMKRDVGFGLDDSAVQAVKTWKFDPAKLDGKPVKTAVGVEVNFRLGS